MDQIEIFQLEDGQTQISVKFDEDTVWLSQGQIVTLFNSSKAISANIQEIFLQKGNWTLNKLFGHSEQFGQRVKKRFQGNWTAIILI